MDAHALRRIALEMAAQLVGARIITIYRPVSSFFIFKISKPALRPYLIFRPNPRAGFLFLSLNKPATPPTPDAVTMRLRKHLTGRKINGLWFDWQKPALYLGLAPRKTTPASAAASIAKTLNEAAEQALELYLILDLNLGPQLSAHLPPMVENMLNPNRPRWDIQKALNSLAWPNADLSKPWQEFPFLTPLLRKTLKLISEPEEKLALLADLETVDGDVFLYAPQDKSLPLLSAWPLPAELSKGLNSTQELVFDSALQALEEAAKSAVFSQINQEKTKTQVQQISREKKRLNRALANLAQEEKKLANLITLKDQAIQLQTQLYLWPQETKLPAITLSRQNLHPSNAFQKLNELTITLDPLLTVRENMALMFKKAAKGQRGLPHLARRRQEIEERLEQLEKLNMNSLLDAILQTPPARPLKAQKAEQTTKSGKVKSQLGNEGKLISKFISPSGLTLLRGRNATGNRQALKLASPFDLWLHAEGGPSAHLIIKLPHPAFEVPNEDIVYAARLVAEKSWQRADSQARIMCTLAKDVHPIKGAPAGTVRVDKILQVIQL